MPWFKVDDTLHSHPKARKAGMEAMGLWAVAGSHCMAYKSNGFVPEWYVKSWARSGARASGRLVEMGLWEPAVKDGQAGWVFHDWDHYQPSAADIEEDREFARQRQSRFRAKKRKQRKLQMVNGDTDA